MFNLGSLSAMSRQDAIRALQWTSHAISIAAALYLLEKMRRLGLKKSLGNLTASVTSLPGLDQIIKSQVNDEVQKSVKEMFPDETFITSLPKEGWESTKVLELLQKLHRESIDPSSGRLFAYAYPLHAQHKNLLKEASNLFAETNALNPTAFPALRRMEIEVVKMTSDLLHGGEGTEGLLTSGGTESILLAVKTYRDRARSLHNISHPNILLPITAHPAFDKALHYFGVEAIRIGVTSKYMADVEEMAEKINRNTILIVVSAPQYPHGVMDPILHASQLAKSRGIPCHVDACIGGFLLPFVKRAGYPVPEFDFELEGVTSISADVHKYGFASKGASVLLFREAGYRVHTYFGYGGWPGGLFVSPGILGTRGGGPIAAAWAALISLGQDGYTKIAADLMATATKIRRGICQIEGLQLVGEGVMSVVAFHSDSVSIMAIADVMEKKGWRMERQQNPSCLHLSLMPSHIPEQVSTDFLTDLANSVETVRTTPGLEKQGTAAMYGMIGKIPQETNLVEYFLKCFLTAVYR